MSDTPPSAELEEALEIHRPIVRETDKRFASIYGYGGAAVLGAAGLVVVAAWLLGWLAHIATYVVAVTIALVGLFVLRSFVNRERHELRQRLEQYCELNGVDPEELREYYEREQLYPYFLSLFETREGS